jgi:hypothetical protein
MNRPSYRELVKLIPPVVMRAAKTRLRIELRGYFSITPGNPNPSSSLQWDLGSGYLVMLQQTREALQTLDQYYARKDKNPAVFAALCVNELELLAEFRCYRAVLQGDMGLLTNPCHFDTPLRVERAEKLRLKSIAEKRKRTRLKNLEKARAKLAESRAVERGRLLRESEINEQPHRHVSCGFSGVIPGEYPLCCDIPEDREYDDYDDYYYGRWEAPLDKQEFRPCM